MSYLVLSVKLVTQNSSIDAKKRCKI